MKIGRAEYMISTPKTKSLWHEIATPLVRSVPAYFNRLTPNVGVTLLATIRLTQCPGQFDSHTLTGNATYVDPACGFFAFQIGDSCPTDSGMKQPQFTVSVTSAATISTSVTFSSLDISSRF
ncbi:uncharacterized protein PV07_12830 [Cladophialophora immunda]|uniref:Uncharacterized protein n=1 Tax=Cladophialophora immunda TaxID=569365 RepID=A0A0D1Z236_9EURO|nr:uncharacterized protein PV07_12830 [Cladophialophora immunda]KIW21741.1 hypothetical protein PV07_12830 [Cladophialophora immunda]